MLGASGKYAAGVLPLRSGAYVGAGTKRIVVSSVVQPLIAGWLIRLPRQPVEEAILDSASNTPFCTLHFIFRISPRAGTVADTFLGPLRPGCDGRVCYSLVKPTKSKHIPVITALPGTKTAS